MRRMSSECMRSFRFIYDSDAGAMCLEASK
ncbi:coiled coil domain containing protein 162 [Echinococcus multilocularis]|uniref:Coiled coil domain containing protein 162 n=1 Tax=Echinococcus multilocularis TaxID=6211 RepID=A0A068XX52_ECHMU|nr:coiled coil domain containing protein 162 [Echinococcus multilocularis]